MPRKSQGILTRESQQTERFHTAWAHCARFAVRKEIRSQGQTGSRRVKLKLALLTRT
jgi:hypothetical protein